MKGHTAALGCAARLGAQPVFTFVRRPEGEHVAGEVGLGRSQVPSLRGGAVGAHVQRLGCLLPGPRGREAVHGGGDAAALGRQAPASPPARQVEARDLGHRLGSSGPSSITGSRRELRGLGLQHEEEDPAFVGDPSPGEAVRGPARR